MGNGKTNDYAGVYDEDRLREESESVAEAAKPQPQTYIDKPVSKTMYGGIPVYPASYPVLIDLSAERLQGVRSAIQANPEVQTKAQAILGPSYVPPGTQPTTAIPTATRPEEYPAGTRGSYSNFAGAQKPPAPPYPDESRNIGVTPTGIPTALEGGGWIKDAKGNMWTVDAQGNITRPAGSEGLTGGGAMPGWIPQDVSAREGTQTFKMGGKNVTLPNYAVNAMAGSAGGGTAIPESPYMQLVKETMDQMQKIIMEPRTGSKRHMRVPKPGSRTGETIEYDRGAYGNRAKQQMLALSDRLQGIAELENRMKTEDLRTKEAQERTNLEKQRMAIDIEQNKAARAQGGIFDAYDSEGNKLVMQVGPDGVLRQLAKGKAPETTTAEKDLIPGLRQALDDYDKRLADIDPGTPEYAGMKQRRDMFEARYLEAWDKKYGAPASSSPKKLSREEYEIKAKKAEPGAAPERINSMYEAYLKQ